MTLQARFDRGGVIVVADRLDAPSATHTPAVRTPEGYLLCDAYIGRDGLLRYSDGNKDWLEHRPREELLAAAQTFTNKPVTDDHPDVMVDASTWTSVAKGVHVDTPVVTEPDAAGVSYLRARLQITDADLIRKIDAGKQVEISMGYRSQIVTAPPGSRYDAVQTAIEGNHTAVVRQGRAGPAARVLMDGVAVAQEIEMAKRKDEVGVPTEEVEVAGPDGEPCMLPSWAAAKLAELATLKAAPQAAAPAIPAAPVQPAAPQGNQQSPPPPMAMAAAAPAQAPAQPPAAAEEDEKVKDALDAFRPIRRRLDRLAIAAGVADEAIDADDPCVTARAYIAKVAPNHKTDTLDAKQLIALVDFVAALPPKEEPKTNPYALERAVPIRTDASDDDSLGETLANFMKGQGY
jgi:hypothetical protein